MQKIYPKCVDNYRFCPVILDSEVYITTFRTETKIVGLNKVMHEAFFNPASLGQGETREIRAVKAPKAQQVMRLLRPMETTTRMSGFTF